MLKVRERVCMPSSLPILFLSIHVTALRNALNNSYPFLRNDCSLSNPDPANMATVPNSGIHTIIEPVT